MYLSVRGMQYVLDMTINTKKPDDLVHELLYKCNRNYSDVYKHGKLGISVTTSLIMALAGLEIIYKQNLSILFSFKDTVVCIHYKVILN